MNIEIIKLIIIMIFIIIFCLCITLPLYLIFRRIANGLDRKNNIEDNKNKNELYRLYMDIDLVKTKEVIDNILKEHISKWIMSNITSQGDNYIKDQEVNELINTVTSKFLLEMSDVHLFYLKCLYNITDDDTLIYYVREEVKYLVLEIITEFNKTE